MSINRQAIEEFVQKNTRTVLLTSGGVFIFLFIVLKNFSELNLMNLRLVNIDSYISKSEVIEKYTPNQIYESVRDELNDTNKELGVFKYEVSKKYISLDVHNSLKKELKASSKELESANNTINKLKSEIYQSHLQHCNKFALERDNVIVKQINNNNEIHKKLKIHKEYGYRNKSEKEIELDLRSVEEKKRYLELLNVQYEQLISAHSKCLENGLALIKDN